MCKKLVPLKTINALASELSRSVHNAGFNSVSMVCNVEVRVSEELGVFKEYMVTVEKVGERC